MSGTVQGRLRMVSQSAMRIAGTILSEGLRPGQAAAAVFTGVFIGTVPIYGFQLVLAAAAAVALGLNKPLTLAATFINNPLLQPALVVGSIGTGRLLLTGKFGIASRAEIWNSLYYWVVGSVALGAVVGGALALATFVIVGWRLPGRQARRTACGQYRRCSWADRGFVRWKLRLDGVFDYLEREDTGGSVVDLGCGHGSASAFLAALTPRRVDGCDLDARRIAAARLAFGGMDAGFEVEDARRCSLPPSSMILIMDVLQYLDAAEQQELLRRCASALRPGGKLIFRTQDCRRGFSSVLSAALDRIVFRLSGAERPPLILTAWEYRGILEQSGLSVRAIPFRNRLGFAHLLVVARKEASS